MRGALEGRGIRPRIVFLEARDEVLIRRFSETRHRHPLGTSAASPARSPRSAGSSSRSAPRPTSSSTRPTCRCAQLRERLFAQLGRPAARTSSPIQLISFGYKFGVPLEADLVFDVRFIQNPYYIDELRPHSGLTQEVRDYVLGQPAATRFLKLLRSSSASRSRPMSKRARPG